MKYLFDASSIYRALQKGKAELLIGNYTCSLSIYEICNALLTERYLKKTLNEQEQKTLLGMGKRALNLMVPMGVTDSEQYIIDFAVKFNLTFYDASYAYLSKKTGVVLITEDVKMVKKVQGNINTLSLDNL
jgi:predicted nucleic acid-binding protein